MGSCGFSSCDHCLCSCFPSLVGEMDFLSMFLVILSMAATVSSRPFGLLAKGNANVVRYGAVGDGVTDDTQAFIRAWSDVCAGNTDPTLTIPRGRTYLLGPVEFLGPCKPSNINVYVPGRIVAPGNISDYNSDQLEQWIYFGYVDGLTIHGNGQIDGRGAVWWQAFKAGEITERPTAMKFHGCKNLVLKELNFINSQRNHISISGSNHAKISYLTISAPGSSPNTDGINVVTSQDVRIEHCNIGTGDDCIAFGNATSHVYVQDVNCGPGHGISVGSLGLHGSSAQVEDIQVDNCTFTGTQNGARIKTWQGGSGYARQIKFSNIQLNNSEHPIIIDQYYCPNSDDCKTSKSAVQLFDVAFSGFRGTSATDEAINLSCSKAMGCYEISLADINIRAEDGNSTYSSCINAHGTVNTTSPPVECLNP